MKLGLQGKKRNERKGQKVVWAQFCCPMYVYTIVAIVSGIGIEL